MVHPYRMLMLFQAQVDECEPGEWTGGETLGSSE